MRIIVKSILFVDDEKQILRAINRLFMDSSYKLFFAEDGVNALNILKSEKINLIVTDIKMPNLNGYELLTKVKKEYPSVIRVILSGYTDVNLVFSVIQMNLARLCIYKPWNNDKLIKVINQIFEVEELLKSQTLLSVIKNTEDLPAMLSIYTELSSMFDEKVHEDEIISKIEEDQSITVRILRIVNSGLYEYNISSVRQAVKCLGMDSVKNIVLTNTVFDSLSDEHELKKDLWQHVSLTSKITGILYKHIGNLRPADCFTAALLHDIGKVVFVKNFSQEYIKYYECVNKDLEALTVDFERSKIGVSHQEMGGYLLSWWGLPHHIVETALFHHDPLNSKVVNKEIISLVHLADFYANKLTNNNQGGMVLNEDVFKVLNITEKFCEGEIYRKISL